MNLLLPTEIKSNTSSRLSDCTISYIDLLDNSKDYFHHGYKLIISLDKTFTCLIDGQVLTGLMGVIVNKSVPHAFISDDTNFLVTLITASSVYGGQLGVLLKDQACMSVNPILDIPQFNPLLPPNYMALTNSELILPVHGILNYILRVKQVSKSLVSHSQVGKAIDFIEEHLQDRVWLNDVAGHINLSAHRTRHLFVQQMSMSFSQYVLWRKIKKTLSLAITEKVTLTEACLHFGFTDQSHFNHSLKSVLGMKPREIVGCNRVLL